MKALKNNKRGFAGLLYLVLTVIIGVVLIMLVAVPITKSSITSANLTGNDLTVANTIPTFLVIGGLVLAAGVALFGFMGASKKR